MTMFGIQRAQKAGSFHPSDHVAFGQRHDRVIREDDGQPECQSGQAAFLTGVQPEREPDDGEDDAGHRERQHLLLVHDFVVRGVFRQAALFSFL